MQPLLGAVEAGGTKFVCAVGRSPHDIDDRLRIPTTSPDETLAAVVDFFRPHRSELAAVGVASFGPVELRLDDRRYGWITETPKPGWSDTDVAGPLRGSLEVPVGFDTDVNGAALGEGRWGAAQGLDTFVYVTVGTGVGGGAIVGGEVAHGLVHPEMGHVAVRRLPGDDFRGTCPFHGDCLEGMASGPAVAARWGTRAEELSGERLGESVRIEAHYLAEGLRNIVYVLAPQRIVLGGGVLELDGLLDAVRRSLVDALGGYPQLPEHRSDDFVMAPGLGGLAGLAGGFVLAERAAS